MKVAVILNAHAGRAGQERGREQAELLRQAFADAGVEAEVELCGGAELADTARRAALRGVDAVVAAGGDGTVSAVASALVGGSVPLAVLPMGTLNHFSRDLGMPGDLADAARAIAAGERVRVDVGEVNGQVFLNNSSIGLYPQIVRSRDEMRRQTGRGKWTAMLIAGWRVLRRFPRLAVRVVTGEAEVVSRTPFLFIGNNDYEITPGALGSRARLDAGRLSLYIARASGRLRLFWLMLRAIFRPIELVRELVFHSVTAARVDLRRRRVAVSLDGEVRSMAPPLHYRILARALPVIRAPLVEGTA